MCNPDTRWSALALDHLQTIIPVLLVACGCLSAFNPWSRVTGDGCWWPVTLLLESSHGTVPPGHCCVQVKPDWGGSFTLTCELLSELSCPLV